MTDTLDAQARELHINLGLNRKSCMCYETLPCRCDACDEQDDKEIAIILAGLQAVRDAHAAEMEGHRTMLRLQMELKDDYLKAADTWSERAEVAEAKLTEAEALSEKYLIRAKAAEDATREWTQLYAAKGVALERAEAQRARLREALKKLDDTYCHIERRKLAYFHNSRAEDVVQPSAVLLYLREVAALLTDTEDRWDV